MNAAVFVDFENLYLSLKTRTESTGLRTRDHALQILEGLLSRQHKKGNPMVLGRSYAAFDTYPGVEVAHDLALMGLDPQYVLVSHTGKNSADVQLALDVSRVVFRRQDIQMIVIVAGDRDFIPLARVVLEEGRDLRIVGIPDSTSGDLRERVGEARFISALDLVPARPSLAKSTVVGLPPGAATEPWTEARPRLEPRPEPNGKTREASAATGDAGHGASESPEGATGNILGHVPVTWQPQRAVPPEELEDRLQRVLEMLIRTRIRHNSPDVWLSPFLKGPMSQHFSNLVHPERRALVNELRNRGAIHVEERENAYADHPYSVIVIDESHPMSQAAWERASKGP